MERWQNPNRTHARGGPTWHRDPSVKLNIFQTVFLCIGVWVVLILLAWILTGCAAPAPLMMKPDIIEIEVPVPVMAPFDCQCQCQPHKSLELEVEEPVEEDRFLYNPQH